MGPVMLGVLGASRPNAVITQVAGRVTEGGGRGVGLVGVLMRRWAWYWFGGRPDEAMGVGLVWWAF